MRWETFKAQISFFDPFGETCLFFYVRGHVCVFYSFVSMTVIQFDNQFPTQIILGITQRAVSGGPGFCQYFSLRTEDQY